MPNFKTKKTTALDAVIDNLLLEMSSMKVDDANYADAVDQLTKLHALKTQDRSSRVSSDTLVAAGANLAGILIIVGYEQKHVVTSKALSFLRMLK
jgi:hypothetical protein